jgi:hypothetical protein
LAHRIAALRRRLVCPTHKRTEGRASVWGSEFTTKDARYRGGSAEIAAGLKRNLRNLVTAWRWCVQPSPLEKLRISEFRKATQRIFGR